MSFVTKIQETLFEDTESLQAAVVALTTVICIVSAFYVVKKFIKTDAESAAMGAKGTVTDKDGHRRSTRQAKTPQRFDPTKEGSKPQLLEKTPEKKTPAAAETRTPRARRANAAKKEDAPTPNAVPKSPRTAPKKTRTPRGKQA